MVQSNKKEGAARKKPDQDKQKVYDVVIIAFQFKFLRTRRAFKKICFDSYLHTQATGILKKVIKQACQKLFLPNA